MMIIMMIKGGECTKESSACTIGGDFNYLWCQRGYIKSHDSYGTSPYSPQRSDYTTLRNPGFKGLKIILHEFEVCGIHMHECLNGGLIFEWLIILTGK